MKQFARILDKDFFQTFGIVQSPFLANGCHNVKFCDSTNLKEVKKGAAFFRKIFVKSHFIVKVVVSYWVARGM